ncbi:unnamed protein product, partial [Lampetra fluviatilis]
MLMMMLMTQERRVMRRGWRLELLQQQQQELELEETGLDGLAKKFGLTPQQFGENLRDSYQRHETEQFPADPHELARDYICTQFPTVEAVLEGARYMVALTVAREPLVRQVVRQTFLERAKLNVVPTKKGRKEIDESHLAFAFKYLRNKPVKELKDDQFLKISLAVDEKLLEMEINIDMTGPGYEGDQTYFDEIKQFHYRDEFSHQVQQWNEQRSLALLAALRQFLYPQMARETQRRLLAEARTCVAKSCFRRLDAALRVAPFRPELQQQQQRQQRQQQRQDDDDDDDDFPESGEAGAQGKGLRVLGVAYSPERDTPVFCALVSGDGEVTDFLRLPHFMKRRNAWRETHRDLKVADIESLKKFLLNKKPQVVVVGAENRDAMLVVEDIRRALQELESEQQLNSISVELVPNDLATLYMGSAIAEAEFRDYPPALRQAVSLARRLQDPLLEFSQLAQGGGGAGGDNSSDDDDLLLCLKLHPLQEHVDKEELVSWLQEAFINRVNEAGVDVNRALAQPHAQPPLGFVCGLGPRKASHLLKVLKQHNARLENRTQLTLCHMGPKVFINCAGFIKIDTSALGDSTDAYVEVLDGSRIHPETYEWARKMAVDALEYDESAEGANPAEALVEILENPERLKDLDLDAFAEELDRQGYGNKGITLYDIRTELHCRYRDLRSPYRSPTAGEAFNLLTKETPETFHVGKLVTAVVTGIAHRRPQGESNDQAIRIDATGLWHLWQCPFCQQDDFPELSEVWNHFDSGACPGQAIGVKLRLDNGVSGFIPTRYLSDRPVRHPEERVKVGMMVHCRVMRVDVEKLTADLTTRSSDLADSVGEWRPRRDDYYDTEHEERVTQAEDKARQLTQRAMYVKRVIVHPSFHNVNYKQAEALMGSLEQGEAVIRPSSKGTDHLTVTWKVADGVSQHLDVREERKENPFSLGHSLWINGEEFEDLDEIIARHVQPMASLARDLLSHKYYRKSTGGDTRRCVEELLAKAKRERPSQIPYLVSASTEFPGKFLLGYQPRNKPWVEFVTVTPDGFRYRGQIFPSVNALFRWFKEHFRDPIPGVTPGSGSTRRTPSSVSATPANINFSDLQRAVNSLTPSVTSQMYSALATVAGQGGGAGGGGSFSGGSSAYH